MNKRSKLYMNLIYAGLFIQYINTLYNTPALLHANNKYSLTGMFLIWDCIFLLIDNKKYA